MPFSTSNIRLAFRISLVNKKEYDSFHRIFAISPLYIDGGKSAGISIDFIKQITKELPYSVKFKPQQFQVLLDELQRGEIQVFLNASWPNDYLKGKRVIATDPNAVFEPVAFTLRGKSPEGDVYSADYISGKRVALQKGSYVENLVSMDTDDLVPVENDIEGMAKLIWRQVDAIITEREVGNYLSGRFFQNEIVAVNRPHSKLDVVIVLNEKDTELRDDLNRAISRIS